MALSKDEIAQIAKEVARQVISDTQVYRDPVSVSDGIRQTMGEELTASMWYQLRAKNASEHGDHKTADLYNHIAREENQHYEQLNKRLLILTGG